MDRWIKDKSVEKTIRRPSGSRVFTITKYKKGKNYLTLTIAPKNKDSNSYGEIDLYGRTLFKGEKHNTLKFLKDLIAKDDAYMIAGLIDNPQKIGAKRVIKHVGHVNFMFSDRKDRMKAIKKLKNLGIKMNILDTLDDKNLCDHRYILTINHRKFLGFK